MEEGVTVTKYAGIIGRPEVIAAFMPDNYKVVGYHETDDTIFTFIEGEDDSGWTLDGYVRPRLESGLYFGLVELLVDPFSLNSPEDPYVTPWPIEER